MNHLFDWSFLLWWNLLPETFFQSCTQPWVGFSRKHASPQSHVNSWGSRLIFSRVDRSVQQIELIDRREAINRRLEVFVLSRRSCCHGGYFSLSDVVLVRSEQGEQLYVWEQGRVVLFLDSASGPLYSASLWSAFSFFLRSPRSCHMVWCQRRTLGAAGCLTSQHCRQRAGKWNSHANGQSQVLFFIDRNGNEKC